LPDIIRYVEKNLDLANKLVTNVISLDEINKGFDMMRNGESGRIVITF
jgi:Zn-dependent alcohol dehydrogenase